MRGMESTRKQKQNRAIRMEAMAEHLVSRAEKKIKAEGVLQAPEIVPVFAIACAKVIVQGHNADPALGAELAGTALRIIMKNLMLHGVTIPDLNMEDWTPPNIHSGTTSQH
jgi:hypothetical protein